MRKLLFGMCCGLALTLSHATSFAETTEVPRVVAIIVGATSAMGTRENPGIGRGVKYNVDRLNDMLDELTKTAKILVLKFPAVGRDFGCAQINKILDKLKVRPNDTVIFYYAGHGLRAEAPATAGRSADQFPTLWCTYPDGPSGKELPFMTIVNRLYSLGPRLVIGIADACNRESAEGPTARGGLFNYSKASLRQLWLGYKGMLVFSAAVPGEDAYYAAPAPENKEAAAYGFFSKQLFDAIDQEVVDGSPPRWEAIEQTAIAPIPVPQVGATQHPQFDDFRNDPVRNLQSIGIVP